MPTLETVGLDFFDAAQKTLATETDIAADVADVWEVLVDNSSWERWFAGAKSVTAEPSTWSAPGDTRRLTIPAMTVDEVAVSLTPSEQWAMCITRTNLPFAKRMIEVVDLTDTSRHGETRTELRWRMAADPHPLTAPFWSVIESRLAATWSTSFENLHHYLNGD